MGGSGCGKSTLLRHLIGLKAPAAGKVYYSGESLWDALAGGSAQDPEDDGCTVSEGRAVEFDDARREHRIAAARVHRSFSQRRSARLPR